MNRTALLLALNALSSRYNAYCLNYLSRISQVYILHVQWFAVPVGPSAAVMHAGKAGFENTT